MYRVKQTLEALVLRNQRVKAQSLLQNNEIISHQIQRAFQISWMGATGPAYHSTTLCNISQPQGLLSKSNPHRPG
jgi:hypothetical protein